MKKAFVFDIDGTLADNSHRLHYIQGEKKDWDSFYAASSEDKPIEAVTELARFLDNGGPLLNLDSDYAVVFCTGRPESTRRATGSWLSLHCQIFPMAMYMRKDGDHRPDYVVKEEMIAQMRADGYEPILAIEDRKQVVDMWRRNGIMCLQCAEGNF